MDVDVKRRGFFSAPEPIVKSEVVYLRGMRSAAPAAPRPVAPPWPEQVPWREALAKKTGV